MKDFFDRLDMFMKISDLNDNKMTVQAGLSVGAIGKQRKGSRGLSNDSIAKILYTYPDLNADWLLTGRGEMLKSEEVCFDNETQSLPPTLKEMNYSFGHKINNQRIPLYDISAAAGIVSLFSENKSIPLDYITIPNLSKVDGAVYVVGDSMYPILKSGDIILIKQVSNFDYISYGDMYLLSFAFEDEEYTCVKYIQKSQQNGYIKLISHNQNHNEREIPISTLRALAIVKASIRYNTMG